ncbi:hypothetical protein PVK06_009490 [Gossypium arboreum]|uniref:Uncharacterized protein n=1 Tax=Gossypium arboreum TaxID=29729 RepID=A0ABR0QNU5_GOSAR|nr:hypothetical protein PVK06_009490 [Gossypium arboreum]
MVRTRRKPYLLSLEASSRQLCQKRERRSPQYIFQGTDISYILHPHVDINVDTNVKPDVDACPITDADTDPIINASDNALVIANILGFYDTLRLQVNSVTNIHSIIVLSGWVINETIFSWSGGYIMGG